MCIRSVYISFKMKIILGLFLIKVYFCLGDSEPSTNYWRENVYGRINYGNDGYKYDRIERPCVLRDVDCIRRVFAQNSNCKPVRGPVAEPYILDWLPIHIANSNLTFILKNAQIRGLNDWKIKEFYINKATDKLVLEVVFNVITVYCPSALVKYHRKGREPVELSDYSNIMYKDISLTLTVPNYKGLRLSEAEVFAYIPDANPPYRLGPNMFDDTDALVSAAFTELISNIAVNLREAFVFKGPAIMSAFLEGNICDFYDKKTLY